MMALRKNPHIYEINLMTWLDHLSHKENRTITLKDIPRHEWRRLKDLGMDLIWLMGMWQRSPYSQRKARNEAGMVKECQSILDDFDITDIVGSPYSIYNYEPNPTFGTLSELRALKAVLEEEGLLLILDFVPNHIACDHPWVKKHPDRFIQGEKAGSGKCDKGFFLSDTAFGEKCMAYGKDPYFPPWSDTAQINYFHPETAGALVETLTDLSAYCHGFRCDMAMLVLSAVFKKTWGPYLSDRDAHPDEFWPLAIDRLKSDGNPFLMLAEAYWDRETELIGHGFDYVYDKNLYDVLVKADINGVRSQISRPVGQQEKMIRFLENHDEPRAAAAFSPGKIRCAMIIQATLPGMRFWQHGQLEGNRIRVPVQLRREPPFPGDDELTSFARFLLKEINHIVFHEGHWELCIIRGWPDNQSHHDLLAWFWELGEERRLIVVNFSASPAQGYIQLPPDWVRDVNALLFHDPLENEKFYRPSSDIEQHGLFVDLESNGWHFFKIERLPENPLIEK
ncbi:MAG: alpha-amylase [Deltaproteobacteria bacterium]|nr:alpha-amylase [Deltaproteobacteria bacterium]